jgi:peptidoglycan/LPS O-acetylase OafA/YrhL
MYALALAFRRLGDAGVLAGALWRGNLGLFAATGFALMVAASVGLLPCPHPRLPRLARGLGALSYGIYLFHNAPPLLSRRLWPALDPQTLALVSAVLTLLLAAALYRTVEAPCRRLGRRWDRSVEIR